MRIDNMLSEIESKYANGDNPILIGPQEFAEYEKYSGYPGPQINGPNKIIYRIAYKNVFVERNPGLMMFPELAKEPN